MTVVITVCCCDVFDEQAVKERDEARIRIVKMRWKGLVMVFFMMMSSFDVWSMCSMRKIQLLP